jgi:hypothetical protein
LALSAFGFIRLIVQLWEGAGKLAAEARQLNLPTWEDYPRELPREVVDAHGETRLMA